MTGSVLALAVSIKDSWESLNVSMLLPSPGQKVKDCTHVHITTGLSFCALRESIFNPLLQAFKKVLPLTTSHMQASLPVYHHSASPPGPEGFISGSWVGVQRAWNCPPDQLMG